MSCRPLRRSSRCRRSTAAERVAARDAAGDGGDDVGLVRVDGDLLGEISRVRGAPAWRDDEDVLRGERERRDNERVL